MDTLITHLQIFWIGFTFGIAGPCLLVCAPAIITYIVGTKRKLTESFGDIIIFLAGRLVAYVLLGYTAGLSGSLLRAFTDPHIIRFFKPLGGAVCIILGIFVILYKEPDVCAPKSAPYRFGASGGVFTLGFLLGIAPCGPLLALLFEIVLISKNGFGGALYALSFGLGTFLSGFIVMGALAGILTWLPAKALKSKASSITFKIICALFLLLLGLSLML